MKVGDEVRWPWGSGTAAGPVREVIGEPVIRPLRGAEVTRHGTPCSPALSTEQEEGDEVLRLASEMERT